MGVPKCTAEQESLYSTHHKVKETFAQDLNQPIDRHLGLDVVAPFCLHPRLCFVPDKKAEFGQMLKAKSDGTPVAASRVKNHSGRLHTRISLIQDQRHP